MSSIQVFIFNNIIKLLLYGSHDIRKWVQINKSSGERGIFLLLSYSQKYRKINNFKAGVVNSMGMARKGCLQHE